MNRLFLTAITGEISLFVMHGIKNQGYNPLVLFRKEMAKEGVIVKNSVMGTLLAVRQVYKDAELKEHALLEPAIQHQKKKEETQKLMNELTKK